MPHRYRCAHCRATSAPGSRRAAEEFRQRHRDEEHGGLVPDGESLDRVPGSTPHPDGRYVSTGVVLVLLLLLVLAECVARLSGA